MRERGGKPHKPRLELLPERVVWRYLYINPWPSIRNRPSGSCPSPPRPPLPPPLSPPSSSCLLVAFEVKSSCLGYVSPSSLSCLRCPYTRYTGSVLKRVQTCRRRWWWLVAVMYLIVSHSLKFLRCREVLPYHSVHSESFRRGV